jgi:hypothetical protein
MSYRSSVCLWLSREAVKKMVEKNMKEAFETAFGKPVRTRSAGDGKVWHCPRTGWNQEADEDGIMGFLESLDNSMGELYELIVVGEGEDDWQEQSNHGQGDFWRLSSEVVFFFDGRPVK